MTVLTIIGGLLALIGLLGMVVAILSLLGPALTRLRERGVGVQALGLFFLVFVAGLILSPWTLDKLGLVSLPRGASGAATPASSQRADEGAESSSTGTSQANATQPGGSTSSGRATAGTPAPSLQQLQTAIGDRIKALAGDRVVTVNVFQAVSTGGGAATYGVEVSLRTDPPGVFRVNEARLAMLNALADIEGISQALYTGYKEIHHISYSIQANLRDTYGNIKSDLWFRVVLSAEHGYKINFANLDPLEVSRFLEWQYTTATARQIYALLTGAQDQ